MESFFDLVKNTGKGFYEFVLFLFTMVFCLAVSVFVPVEWRPHSFLGLVIISVLALANARIITFICIFAMFWGLSHHGYFDWS